MRTLALLCCVAVLAGCTRAEDRSAGAETGSDTLAAAGAVPEAGTVSLSDFAGTWKLRSTDAAGNKPIETELHAKADTSGWTLVGPDKKSYPVRVVAVAGDSVVAESGPRPSFRIKGAQVTTHSVYRLQGDKLVGNTEPHLKIGGRDSLAQLQIEGTRAR